MSILKKNLNKIMKYTTVTFAALAAVIYMGTAVMIAHAEPGTVTSNARMRSAASTSGEQLTQINANTAVEITGETTGDDGQIWYQVTVNGTSGYIRSDLVSKGAAAASTSLTETATSTAAPAAANVTAVDNYTVYVTTDCNIRQGASTSDSRVAGAKVGAELTVTGTTTGADGKTWLQVSFSGRTGFIRSDLVSQTQPADAAGADGNAEGTEANTAEGEGTADGEAPLDGEGVPEGEVPTPETEAEPETEAGDEAAGTSGLGGITVMNPAEAPEVIPKGFEEMTLDNNGESVTIYNSGTIYLVYGTNAAGEEGWFYYDSASQSNIHYFALEGGSGGLFNILTIILLVALVIAIAVIVLLVVRGGGSGGSRPSYRYDDDDDEDDEYEDDEDDDEYDDEDDDDEYEDDEDDDDYEEDVRRKSKKGGLFKALNFMSREDDDEYEDDDDDDYDEDDDDYDDEDEDDEFDREEEVRRRMAAKREARRKQARGLSKKSDDDFDFIDL